MTILSRQNVLVSVATMVEWMEFTFFAYMMTRISNIFFPDIGNENLVLIAGFAAFSVSYVARPLGGIIFGIIGDKIGRKPALFYSVIFMGLATAGIGFIPSFAVIGFFAPILLVVFRIIQGISMSGELIGSSVYLFENNKKQKYVASSFTNLSSTAGMMLGAAFAFAVSIPGLPDWSWRIPFIFGGILLFFIFYLRKQITESVVFLNIKERNIIQKNSLKFLMQECKVPILKTFSISAFINVYIYICHIWWFSYLHQNKFFDNFLSNIFPIIMNFFAIICTLFFAYISDKKNTNISMNIGFLLAPISTILLFFNQQPTFFLVFFATVIYGLTLGLVFATMFNYIPALFPPFVRYTGQSVAWNFGAAIFAGSGPIIAQNLYLLSINFVILYVSLISLLCLIIVNLTNTQLFKN